MESLGVFCRFSVPVVRESESIFLPLDRVKVVSQLDPFRVCSALYCSTTELFRKQGEPVRQDCVSLSTTKWQLVSVERQAG